MRKLSKPFQILTIMDAIKDPFKVCFQFLHWYRFYLPTNSKWISKYMGFSIFCCAILQYFIASIYRLEVHRNLNEILLPILHVIFSLNLVFKLLNFKLKEEAILKKLKKFEELQKNLRREKAEKRFKLIKLIVTGLIGSDLNIGTVLGLSILAFSREKSFILPVLFQSDNDIIHYILFALAFPSVVVVGTSLTSVESIFTVSLIMVETHLKELEDRIRTLDVISRDDLKFLVEYQLEILEYVIHFEFPFEKFFFYRIHSLQRRVESCFGSTLLLQSSSISFFLCILVYGVINSSAKENPYIFIYFIGFTLLAFSKISIPHFLGQRVINQSGKLVNALYEKPWYDYNILQRKSLQTLMIYNQKCSKINVEGFYDLDFENLGKVSEIVEDFLMKSSLILIFTDFPSCIFILLCIEGYG